MANLVNPYSDITHSDGNVPSDSGTWTYTGSGSTGVAPLPPDPPTLFDDDIDFDGVDAGTYPYTYTVLDCDSNPITATVTYTVIDQIPISNDVCSGARTLVFPYQGGVSKLTNQTFIGSCPGPAAPTLSAFSIPTGWGSTTFSADLWYKVTFDVDYPVPPIIVMSIDVDGTPYGTEGISQPFIAVYSICDEDEVIHAESPVESQQVTVVIDNVFNADFTYYIRVGVLPGNEGKFDINITV